MSRAKRFRRIRKKAARNTPLVSGLSGRGGVADVPDLVQFEAKFLDDYHPHAKQRALHEAIHQRFVAVIAGRRGGKTYACGREFLRRVFRDFDQWRRSGGTWETPSQIGPETDPALEYWVVSPTHALASYPKREVFNILGGRDGELVLKYNQSKGLLWLRGGILIQFKSADRPDSLVAAGLSGIWCDEAARFKSDVWDENLSATLADRQGWALFSSTPLGKNWLYDQIWNHTPLGRGETWDGYFGIHWTTRDNTTNAALQDEVARAERELPEAVFRRNYMASFDAFAGKIFEEFMDDSTHLVRRVPWEHVVRKYGGLDWGFNNPGVQLEIAETSDGLLYVYNEDYQNRLTIAPPPNAPSSDCWVNRLGRAADIRDVEYWWADPSRPEHIETCDDYDIEVRSADNAVQPGIEAVATLLKPVPVPGRPGRGQPALHIHEDCVHLRRELSGYRYREGDTEKPVKEDDHAPDALRYAVFSEHRHGGGIARLDDFSIFRDAA